MYYAIIKSGVVCGKTKKDIERDPRIHGRIDIDEMTSYGPDFVVKLTNDDINFVQDKRKLSQIMFQNFFKQDNSLKLFVILNLVFTVINLFM